MNQQDPGADAMPGVETGMVDRGGLARPSAAAPVRWTARIPSIRNPDKYCRVEVEGSRIEDEPIALVKEARLAVVIAALPLLADALTDALVFIPVSSPLWERAKSALAAMEGN